MKLVVQFVAAFEPQSSFTSLVYIVPFSSFASLPVFFSLRFSLFLRGFGPLWFSLMWLARGPVGPFSSVCPLPSVSFVEFFYPVS